MIQFNLLRSTPDFLQKMDDVGFYVQEIGGEFYFKKKHIAFHVPVEYTEFMILKFSYLKMEEYVW
jgi:hypothetical protein